jgi:hypothetical protein
MQHPRRLSREVSYDNFVPHYYGSLDEWKAAHPSVVPFLSFISPDHPTSSTDPFEVRRLKVHERIITDLERFKESLNSLGATLQRQSAKFELTLPVVTFRFLDLTVLKSMFIRTVIVETKESVISQKIWALMQRQNDVRSTLNLLSSELIPEDRYCRLSESFLTMNFNVDEQQQVIQRLTVKLQALKNQIDVAQRSLVWMTDFDGYIVGLIKEAEVGIDRLVYVKSVDSTLSLAVSVVFADELDAIRDKPIELLAECLSETCRKMVPDSILTKRQYGLGLLLIFRVVYEILGMPGASRSGAEELEKGNRFRKLPCRAFGLPEFCVKGEKLNLPVRDVFNGTPYREAVDFLNLVNWSTNPFDRLYHVHRALEVIAACARQGARLEDTSTPIQVVAFDDRFPIFLATVMASDMIDVAEVVNEARTMLKCFQLSPQFQYALETLEALLIVHADSQIVDGVIKMP